MRAQATSRACDLNRREASAELFYKCDQGLKLASGGRQAAVSRYLNYQGLIWHRCLLFYG